MKKYICILVALCTLAAVGCNKEETASGQMLEILEADTSFPAEGAMGTVKFRADASLKGKVEAEPSKSWVTILNKGEDVISFRVDASLEALDRSADITLTAGGYSATFTITQRGVTFDLDGDETELVMDPTKSTATLTYDNSLHTDNLDITIQYMDPENTGWLDCYTYEKKVWFEADLNLSNRDRVAVVSVKLGWKTAVVTVSQKAASAVAYSNFGCDAEACTSEKIKLADYALEALGNNWDVNETMDWITCTKQNDGIVIQIESNNSGEDREGGIEFVNGSTVISTLPVRQTSTTIHDIAGAYHFPYAAATWVWDIKASEDEEGLLLAKAFAGGIKAAEYAIRLNYTKSGENAPSLLLKLPQDLGVVGSKTRKLWPVSYLDAAYNVACSFELVYQFGKSPIVFDFKTATSPAGWSKGIKGLALINAPSGIENMCLPDSEYGCLYLKKWGSGNHDGFTDM